MCGHFVRVLLCGFQFQTQKRRTNLGKSVCVRHSLSRLCGFEILFYFISRDLIRSK